eukprot:1176807-Prorocentrum_minimum.AAC.6
MVRNGPVRRYATGLLEAYDDLSQGWFSSQVDIVIALLERGALPDLENNESHTALTLSCKQGALLGIQALVQYGERRALKA